MNETTNKGRRTNSAWLLALALVTLPPEILAWRVMSDGYGSSAEARVAAMTAAERIEAAASIEEYSVQFRRALYRQLPVDAKAGVWRQVHETYREQHDDIAEGTLSLLDQAMALIVPATFAGDPANVASALEVAAALRTKLGEEDYQTLFNTFGPLVGAAALDLSIVSKVSDWIRGAGSLSASFLDCNCYHLNQVDCDGFRCSELQGCEFSYFGCGTWYLEPCDGYCIPTNDN